MILLLSLWTLYFILHSALAAEPVKHWFQRVSGISRQGYRIAYNLFNLFGLLGLLWVHIRFICPPFYESTTVLIVAGAVLSLTGLTIMIQSAREYELSSFLGLSKETHMPLQIKGLHKYMRHPLYSGTLLFFTGICIAFPFYKNWYLLLLMIVYLFIGMWLEERKLIAVFGDQYKDYMKRVKRLIPGIV
ncbi:methyltransferase [Lacibacter sp. H375]|uniref:methyltransferase family protein n=1 Tax=Lacibacter sp. H375 TaxID=3133424 RepID=UPI0030C199BE